MVFSSAYFLFWFLPLLLTCYFVSPRRLRNSVALAGSLYFYAWGAPLFVFVLLGSTMVDDWISRRVAASRDDRVRKWLVGVDITANLGLLVYFKYANFLVEQVDALVQALGGAPLTWERVALPIGISFFTFQKISYVVDVYRGRASPARHYGDYLLYVALFPQLIAGPIVRYHDIDQQIRHRIVDARRFWHGVERFTLGLAKKALIANPMASLCDPVYAHPVSDVSTGFAWLAAVAYYFQIYFDFSGYSDMAIGLGRMLGFEFLENFERPYTATTFTEFWRRWHISLSNFMREYLYIPLGGNRVSPARAYANLWIVFLVSGLWHGAAWTFVLWGAYQGLFLTLDKMGWLDIARRVPRLLLRIKMVFLVMVSWVIFRSETLPQAWSMLRRMFTGGGPHWYETTLAARVPLDTQTWALLTIAAVASFLPWSNLYADFERRAVRLAQAGAGWPVSVPVTLLALVVACLAVVNSSHNPFIYFRF
ncbi:MAG: MBOAT family O-acyltransferase [Planctomycetota bacterium]